MNTEKLSTKTKTTPISWPIFQDNLQKKKQNWLKFLFVINATTSKQ